MKSARKSLDEIFRNNNVSFAYLFWSRARNENDKKSDIDIWVYLRNKKDREYLKKRGEQISLINDLMDYYGRNDIDIVILNDVESELLKYNILTEWKLIFEEDVNFRIENETKLSMQAKDYVEKHLSKHLK